MPEALLLDRTLQVAGLVGVVVNTFVMSRRMHPEREFKQAGF